MTILPLSCLVIALAGCLPFAQSFAPHPERSWVGQARRQDTGWNAPMATAATTDTSTVVDDWDDDRKASLFQYLLRDLQVEGVPLLAIDADPQEHILQAALWTTLAELSEQTTGQKACMVFEQFSVPVLRTFVNQFTAWQSLDRFQEALPELSRFTLSVVGQGVGPAILIETANATDTNTFVDDNNHLNQDATRELQNQAAVKGFLAQMGSTTTVPPSPPDDEEGPTLYKSCPFGDTSHILSVFWNQICQLMATPDLGSIVWTLDHDPVVSLARFAALSELFSQSISLYGEDAQAYDLTYFHPQYNRDSIFPKEEPAPGHIPPKSWIHAMVQQQQTRGGDDDTKNAIIATCVDYQRRSPVPAVWIRRVSERLLESNGTELVLENGTTVTATHVASQAQIALDLAAQGKERLEQQLQSMTPPRS